MQENNNNVLLYGSLRKGNYNYERFMDYFPKGLEFKSTTTIKGFDLYDLGSYPGIKKSDDPEKVLVVDIMTCSDDCFNSINRMELGAGYSAETVMIDETPYTIYLYEGRVNPSRLVATGDWNSRKLEVTS